ncbi:734_t:CDS:2, partial [Scutellospora calospora]
SIRAFLSTNEPANWYYEILIDANNCLKRINSIFKQYATFYNINRPTLSNLVQILLSFAKILQNNRNTTLTNNTTIPNLVISINDFPPEIYNKDHRYYRLIARFIELNNLILSISYASSNKQDKAIKPIHLQLANIEDSDDNNNEKPYWDDAIDKYFDYLIADNFRNITYSQFNISNAYKEIVNQIISTLNNEELQELILKQLIALEYKTLSINPHYSLTLDNDQYKVYDILYNT